MGLREEEECLREEEGRLGKKKGRGEGGRTKTGDFEGFFIYFYLN